DTSVHGERLIKQHQPVDTLVHGKRLKKQNRPAPIDATVEVSALTPDVEIASPLFEQNAEKPLPFPEQPFDTSVHGERSDQSRPVDTSVHGERSNQNRPVQTSDNWSDATIPAWR
ncbi:MAG: hypothetical protein KDA96_28990, partial [Planctomycetaceae bacterium]|nr:hypothetical protein [Planctomycetaceae bacterium]